MHSSEIKGKSILIVGYGREGKSSHRWLLNQDSDQLIAVADKSPLTLIEQAPRDTQVFSGEQYLAKAGEFDTLLRSPGIPLYRGDLAPLLDEKPHISSLINVFMELAPGTVIGLTGTKGKSTSTALLHCLLTQGNDDVRLVGNIGTPALDSLEGATEETIFVVELSSFQLEDLRHPPSIAVLLNIVPEHLDHHGTFEEYQKAKYRIVGPETKLVCNEKRVLPDTVVPKQRFVFSENPLGDDCEGFLAYLDQDTYVYRHQDSFHSVCTIKELSLPAGSNSQNILAALSVASLLGLSPQDARSGLLAFKPLPHRLENIGEKKGITFFNDSLSTIPEACIHALDSLGSRVETLIVGGHDRGIAYDNLAAEIVTKSSYLQNVILLPETGLRIERLLREKLKTSSSKLELFPVANLADAVAVAFAHTSAGKICLLSPASSSLNQFRDYQERGNAFRECVARG